MIAMFAVRSAECEPCTPHLTALRSLATRRGDAEILREVEALERRAGCGGSDETDDMREERLRVQVRLARRWLDAEARAFVDRQDTQLAPRLEGRLDPFSFLGRRGRAAARREMQLLLRETLTPWCEHLHVQAGEVYLRLARRLRADPPPAWSPASRIGFLLARPAVFLDPEEAVRAVTDLLRSREAAWRRLRRDVHEEVHVLLRANVARIVGDLKEQMDAALASAARPSPSFSPPR